MKWLNYHHLLYFRAIAEEGGLSHASKKLHVGQPALSAQLKNLEENLEEKLFERKSRKLLLTDAGKVVLQYANQIFDLGQELLQVMESKRFTRHGRLHFGVLSAVPKTLVQNLIEAAWKIAKCKVTVLEGTGEELMRALHATSVDVVLSDYPAPAVETKTTYSRSFMKIPVLVYGVEQFRGLKKKFPESLGGQPFIVPTHHSKLRHDLDHYFHSKNIQVDQIAETQDTSVQKLLAINGMGLMAAPTFMVDPLVKEDKLEKIGILHGVYQEFWLISARRVVDNPIATEIIEKFTFRAS